MKLNIGESSTSDLSWISEIPWVMWCFSPSIIYYHRMFTPKLSSSDLKAELVCSNNSVIHCTWPSHMHTMRRTFVVFSAGFCGDKEQTFSHSRGHLHLLWTPPPPPLTMLVSVTTWMTGISSPTNHLIPWAMRGAARIGRQSKKANWGPDWCPCGTVSNMVSYNIQTLVMVSMFVLYIFWDPNQLSSLRLLPEAESKIQQELSCEHARKVLWSRGCRWVVLPLLEIE